MRCFVILLSVAIAIAKKSVTRLRPKYIIPYDRDMFETSSSKPMPKCDITIRGSSTVFPIANEFAKESFGSVTSTGSSDGLESLLMGTVDIGLASRALQARDYIAAGCPTTSGPCGDVLPKCVKVANDAIAVVTSPDVDLGD